MYAHPTDTALIERDIDNAKSYLELRKAALRIHGVKNAAEVRRLRERVLEVAFARFSTSAAKARS